MEHYTQLTREQRYQIYSLLQAKHTQTEISVIVGVDKSTISREIRRNKGLKGYRPNQADIFAQCKKHGKVEPKFSSNDWAQVDKLIRLDWSPEQVSLFLKENDYLSISHERIYQHILIDKAKGGILHTHLRCKKKKRKKRGSIDKRGVIVNRISINDRPKEIEKRIRIGDLEIDLIIGKNHKQAMVTIVDRSSRYLLMAKSINKSADAVTKATISLLLPFKDKVLSITSDNGKEFAYHQQIADALNTDFYFANPYASWERGTNENTNGLIRQYLPKGCSFEDVSADQLNEIMDKLNNRPRKCLKMKTPNEVMFGIKPKVALSS